MLGGEGKACPLRELLSISKNIARTRWWIIRARKQILDRIRICTDSMCRANKTVNRRGTCGEGKNSKMKFIQ